MTDGTVIREVVANLKNESSMEGMGAKILTVKDDNEYINDEHTAKSRPIFGILQVVSLTFDCFLFVS